MSPILFFNLIRDLQTTFSRDWSNWNLFKRKKKKWRINKINKKSKNTLLTWKILEYCVKIDHDNEENIIFDFSKPEKKKYLY